MKPSPETYARREAEFAAARTEGEVAALQARWLDEDAAARAAAAQRTRDQEHRRMIERKIDASARDITAAVGQAMGELLREKNEAIAELRRRVEALEQGAKSAAAIDALSKRFEAAADRVLARLDAAADAVPPAVARARVRQ